MNFLEILLIALVIVSALLIFAKTFRRSVVKNIRGFFVNVHKTFIGLTKMTRVLVIFCLVLIFISLWIERIKPDLLSEGYVKTFIKALATINASEIAIIISLILALSALIESAYLTNELKQVFGFHEYVKKSLGIYRNCKHKVLAILANWEFDNDLYETLNKLKNKKLYFCCSLDDRIPLGETYGDIGTLDRLVGALWRYGLLLDRRTHELPENILFTIPTANINPVRMCCNDNEEALVSSSPISQGKDVYGFYHQDKEVASYVQNTFAWLVGLKVEELEDKDSLAQKRNHFKQKLIDKLHELHKGFNKDSKRRLLLQYLDRMDIKLKSNNDSCQKIKEQVSPRKMEHWVYIENAVKYLYPAILNNNN